MSGYKEQLLIRIERRRLKIRAAVIVRQTLFRSTDVVDDDRPSIRANFFGPVWSIDEWLGDRQLAGLPIKRVEKSVPVRDHNHFSSLARDRQIGLYRYMRGIPIVYVMRSELVVPAELAGVGVEREE